MSNPLELRAPGRDIYTNARAGSFSVTVDLDSLGSVGTASDWTAYIVTHKYDANSTTLITPTCAVDTPTNSATFSWTDADAATLMGAGVDKTTKYFTFRHDDGNLVYEIKGKFVMDRNGVASTSSTGVTLTLVDETLTLTGNVSVSASFLTRTLIAGFLWGFGNSIQKIGPGARATTLSGSHSAGDDVITVATAGALSPGKWIIRESADQNSEYVVIPEGTDCTGAVVKIAAPLVNSHATSTSVVDPSGLNGEVLGRMLAAEYRNRATSGATLCKGGAPGAANYGGYNRFMRELPTPGGVGGASYVPAPGLIYNLTGLNDVGDANLTAAGSTAIIQAYRQATRACLARASAGRFFEAETAFPASAIFTTYAGSGSWSTTSSTAQNTGTGYVTNTSSGATITHALPALWAGPAGSDVRYVDFCFLGNYVGGSFAASQLSFTVDGVTVYPTGSNAAGAYSASNPFTTVDQNPATFGTALPCVARIPVTPTGSAQTIVVTTGTGGVCLDWISWEADYIMPTIWPNVFCTPGSTSQTNTAIPLLNTAVSAVIAEFDSPYIAEVDLYGTLSPAGVAATSSYWTTTVDSTHPDLRGHKKIAELGVAAFQALTLNIAQKASL